MEPSPFSTMLAAYAASQDPRLLVPALDLATSDADIACVLDAAKTADLQALGDHERAKLAASALAADRAELAQHLAHNIDAALVTQIEALLAQGDALAAQGRYRAAIAANPSLEEPALMARIEAMLATKDVDSNVVAFNLRAGQGGRQIEAEDLDHARLSFIDGDAVTFADVGGHDAVKKQIDRRIIAPFRKPALFARFRRKAGGGVLMYGPPGCGKTLLARATAGECQARFINVPVTDVLDKYIGEPERKLAAIFADARRETPTVLFFDEIEALAGKRGHTSSNHEMAVVSTFLAELDGFAQNNEGVLILAATNMPWGVDPAFRRSGRFDRLLFVPPPDRKAREEIVRLQLDGRQLADDLDMAAIAAKTSGYSGADLRNLADTAADFAIEESIDSGGEVPISRAHFAAALEEVKPTTAEWLTTARNFAKYGNSGGQYDEVAAFLDKHGR